MRQTNKKLSPILHKQLSLIPQHPIYDDKINERQSHLFLYQRMHDRLKRKSRTINNSTQYIIVRSQEEKQLMNKLKPQVTPLLSPTNSISISEYLSVNKKQRGSGTQRSKSTFLCHNLVPKKAKNTELDDILEKKQKFLGTYFNQLKQFYKKPAQAKQKQEVTYQFEQVRVNGWRIRGFLRGGFVLLKGLKQEDNYLPPKKKFKKYPYANCCKKIRQNYQQWVNNKFCFED